jgi:hypothetical protein
MTEERQRYLLGLVEDYGVPAWQVFTLAEMLGPNEDYDGLITMIEDLEDAEC